MAGALLHWVHSMLRARVTQTLTLAASLTACTGGLPVAPDGGRADGSGPERDGSVEPGTRGLTLRFVADPALPLTVDDGARTIAVDQVELGLEDLRVIGDSAPGDERTRISSQVLRWPDDGSDDSGDVTVEYADAPPGIYSLFRASVVQFEIEGAVHGGGDGEEPVDYDFEIERHSGAPLALEIDLGSATLEPGGIIDLTVHFDARPAIAAVPWAERSPDDDGELTIDAEDPAMGGIEAAVIASFERQPVLQ